MISDWSKYPNFSKHEFDCQHTGKNNMQPEFMDVLQDIRTIWNRPIIVTSGYRHVTHPIESSKKEPGEHTYGVAADLNIYGVDVAEFISVAFEHGIRRFGLNQIGSFESRFIHIGLGDRRFYFPPHVWTYRG